MLYCALRFKTSTSLRVDLPSHQIYFLDTQAESLMERREERLRVACIIWSFPSGENPERTSDLRYKTE